MQYKVWYNGKANGEAAVFGENGVLTAEYSCPFEENRVYKLYAQLEKESIPLGVMLKNGVNFICRRKLNQAKCGKNGEKIRHFYIEKYTFGSKATFPLQFSAEEFSPCKWIDTPDHALQNCIVDGGVMSCDFEGETYIAAHFSPDEPFALAPFFCLVTMVSHNNKILAVVKLDGKNIPVHLNKTKENQP